MCGIKRIKSRWVQINKTYFSMELASLVFWSYFVVDFSIFPLLVVDSVGVDQVHSAASFLVLRETLSRLTGHSLNLTQCQYVPMNDITLLHSYELSLHLLNVRSALRVH